MGAPAGPGDLHTRAELALLGVRAELHTDTVCVCTMPGNVSDPCFKTVDPSSLLFLAVLGTSPALVYCITTTLTEQETRSKRL